MYAKWTVFRVEERILWVEMARFGLPDALGFPAAHVLGGESRCDPRAPQFEYVVTERDQRELGSDLVATP